MTTMATATLPFSLPLDSPQPPFPKAHHLPSLNNSSSSKTPSLSYTSSTSYPAHPLPRHKSLPLYSIHPSSSSHSSAPPPTSDPYLKNPLPAGRFLDEKNQEKYEILRNFEYNGQVDGGPLLVRLMEEEEVDSTVGLLTESFAESLFVPKRLWDLLKFLVRQYVNERRALLPHVATLVGYIDRVDGKKELAGTVEISFDAEGANSSPATPIPPMESPYICNMAVRKEFRRRGIAWNLLQASEQLISLMTISRDVYLHCRMIDTVPLKMYKKAGYRVIKTDSLFILLMFQRRKHLMCKKLPEPNNLNLKTTVLVDGRTS